MPLVRVEYEKKGRVAYISHLDLIRVIQRAVRRAGIPVEYTKGFNPHAKISFGPALALGTESCGEMMDVQLEKEMEVKNFIERMNASFPDGIRVTKAEYIPDGSASLTALINAAEYTVQAEYRQGGSGQEGRVSDFFNRREIYIEKTSKKGKKRLIDIVPMILEQKNIEVGGRRLSLDLILETGNERNLKPADLLFSLRAYTGLELENVRIQRQSLLIKRGEKYFTPFQVFK
ncbi:MAG: hypothetical protein HPY66_0860 [Firmicutes bacterium]|nr:hypothetical protein [Bacillota bacterium]